jgi:hypothetical protein
MPIQVPMLRALGSTEALAAAGAGAGAGAVGAAGPFVSPVVKAAACVCVLSVLWGAGDGDNFGEGAMMNLRPSIAPPAAPEYPTAT